MTASLSSSPSAVKQSQPSNQRGRLSWGASPTMRIGAARGYWGPDQPGAPTQTRGPRL
ncbi:hypothetical protein QE412_002035 [Microbacterium trichothecenolyticum]|uniref:Uncharacterized protein n=1 Tax=Microbacterium trichothecenolyticum TaxID=69370 RepID=A0ABU0TUX2_MICTR|nr:hypothetical protein [Microbacterium trichothecenolyticum]